MYVWFDVEFLIMDWVKGVEVDGGESIKVELLGRKFDLGLSFEQIVVRELLDKLVNQIGFYSICIVVVEYRVFFIFNCYVIMVYKNMQFFRLNYLLV